METTLAWWWDCKLKFFKFMYVSEESLTERHSYNRQVQWISSSDMLKPEPIRIR